MSVKLSEAQKGIETRVAATGCAVDFSKVEVLGKGRAAVPWAARKRLLEGMDDGWVVVREGEDLLFKGPLWRAREVICPAPRVYHGKGKKNKDGEPIPDVGSAMMQDAIAGFRLAKVAVPKVRTPEEEACFLQHCRELLSHSVTALAYVNGDELVVAGTDEIGGWVKPWVREGAKFLPGRKLGKRVKRLLAPMPFVGAAPGLAVRVIDDPAKEKLLDGVFALRMSVGKAVIAAADASRLKEKALHCRLFNATILLEEGLLKGNCALVADDRMPEGVDVVTHRCNVKPEVKGFATPWVALNPQPPKVGVRTSVQAMLSLPELFREEEVKAWADSYLLERYYAIKEGRLLDDLEELHRLREEDGQETESRMLWLREMAVAWAGAGLTFLHSPTLAPRLLAAQACGLKYVADRELKVTVPVPCSLEEQVVSESAARMLGLDLAVGKGMIRRSRELGLHVVSDQDWVEMLPSHGGCDQDDHFMLFYRKVDGQECVVVMRNPSDLGEYSVFAYDKELDGDGPTSEMYLAGGKRETWSFPEVDLSGAAKRVSEALADGSLEVTGLPKAGGKTRKGFGVESVIDDLRRALEGVSPGLYVNAKMACNAVFGRHPRKMLACMEDAVDACVQGGSVEQVRALKEQAGAWWDAILKSGRPMDRLLWAAKRPSWLGQEPPLEDGVFCRIVEHVDRRTRLLVERLEGWAKEHAVAPPALSALRPETPEGWAEVKDIRRKLAWYRQEAFRLFGKGDAAEWELLRKKLAWLVGETDVCLLGWVIWDKRPVKDSVLWTKPLFRHYVASFAK